MICMLLTWEFLDKCTTQSLKLTSIMIQLSILSHCLPHHVEKFAPKWLSKEKLNSYFHSVKVEHKLMYISQPLILTSLSLMVLLKPKPKLSIMLRLLVTLLWLWIIMMILIWEQVEFIYIILISKPETKLICSICLIILTMKICKLKDLEDTLTLHQLIFINHFIIKNSMQFSWLKPEQVTFLFSYSSCQTIRRKQFTFTEEWSLLIDFLPILSNIQNLSELSASISSIIQSDNKQGWEYNMFYYWQSEIGIMLKLC